MPANRRPDYGETLYSCEYAKSNRSTCKVCGTKIEKDELRIGSIVPGEGDYDMTSWRKVDCQPVPLVVSEEETWTEASQIFGYEKLPDDGKALLEAMMAKAGASSSEPPKKKGKAAASAAPKADEPKAAGKKAAGKKKKKDEEAEAEEEKPKKKAKTEEPPAAGEEERPRCSDIGTYIDCPFKERGEAETLGAKWDFRAKKWCVPFTKALEPFAKWLDANTLAEHAPMHKEAAAAPPVAAAAAAEEAEAEEEETVDPATVGKMTVPALKKELEARGLEQGGKKAELVARLKGSIEERAAAKASKPAAGGAGGAAGSSGGGGGRRVDRAVPGGDDYQVYEDYDVKLMQADMKDGKNANKFYVIQVLQNADGTFAAFNRWGRVGEEGEAKLYPFGGAAEAIKAFEAKFKDKTKNTWAAFVAGSFVKNEGSGGKYGILELDGGGGDGADAAPLGKLSEAQIQKGQAALAKLKAAVDEGDAAAIPRLSSEYYTLIPTTFGRKAPPPLDSAETIGEKEAQLLFWLKMGFEGVAALSPQQAKSQVANPLEGLWEAALCKTLKEACGPGVSDKASIDKSVARGKQLDRQKSGAPVKPMDAQKYGSIVLYTGNSLYRQLNTALRDNHAQVPQYMGYLRLLFEAMTSMPASSVTLWRGIAADLYDEYEPGREITWWSVSSCTSDESVARGFMQQLGGTASLIILQCKKAMDITPLSVYPNEKESLLAPGTRLKVLSRKKVGKVNEIHVEEVGSALDQP